MHPKTDLHKYQVDLISFIKKHHKCGAFLDMGMGKTAVALTAALDLLDDLFVQRVLIIAPLRVANTVWKQEAKNWEHLKHLDIVICTGSLTERKAALMQKADVTVINRENIAWLIENYKWDWNMVIIDESSSFKSHKAKRFKALKKIIKYIDAMLLLTGTPSPNGQLDLWSQLYLIDQGERLGRTITNYRNRYFKASGFKGYGYEILENSAEKINEKIKDVCIALDSDDYLDLPDRIDVVEKIQMDATATKLYKELEKEFIIQLKGGKDITAVSGGALANKLLQVANGAIYDEEQDWHLIHDAKLAALQDIIEDHPNENFMVAYNYKSDLTRLKKTFSKAVVLSKSGVELDAWNKDKIKMLLVHPASAGHGLNAQFGGDAIIWFGLNWSLENYQQLNKRMHRQGRGKPVRIIHLVTQGTVDMKVMKALASKAKTQAELLEYIRRDFIANA